MRLLTSFGLATALFLLSMANGASAGEDVKRPRAVVELFTSQGCSSCPPADKLLGDLARRGDVVALAYHVDYWDYLGWRDTLATPDNTARQHEYSRTFEARSVYTPQAVINGRVHVNGAKRRKVEHVIDGLSGSGEGMVVDVQVSFQSDKLVIETGAAAQPVKDAQIVIVYVNAPTSVEIEGGKNEGRTPVFANSVADFHTASAWSGDETRIEMPLSEVEKRGSGGCAVLIQELGTDGAPGPILGAAIIMRPYGS